MDVAVGGLGGEESGGITARPEIAMVLVVKAESSGELGGIEVYRRCSADGGDGGG